MHSHIQTEHINTPLSFTQPLAQAKIKYSIFIIHIENVCFLPSVKFSSQHERNYHIANGNAFMINED